MHRLPSSPELFQTLGWGLWPPPLPPPNTIHIACMHFSWPHSFSLPCCLCSNTPFLWFSSLAVHLSACYLLISVLFKMGYGHLNPLNWVHWPKEVLSLSFAPSLLLSSSFSFPPFIYFSTCTLQLHFWLVFHILKNSEKPFVLMPFTL